MHHIRLIYHCDFLLRPRSFALPARYILACIFNFGFNFCTKSCERNRQRITLLCIPTNIHRSIIIRHHLGHTSLVGIRSAKQGRQHIPKRVRLPSSGPAPLKGSVLGGRGGPRYGRRVDYHHCRNQLVDIVSCHPLLSDAPNPRFVQSGQKSVPLEGFLTGVW